MESRAKWTPAYAGVTRTKVNVSLIGKWSPRLARGDVFPRHMLCTACSACRARLARLSQKALQ
jgi:hypothetical protein